MLSRSQLIILALVLLPPLIVVGILSGVLPGKKPKPPTEVEASLSLWSIFTDESAYTGLKDVLYEKYQNVRLDIREFTNPEEYERRLLDALAAGRGPDIFMVPATDLLRFLNKITPAPDTLVNSLTVQELFPDVVSKDAVRNGVVYGLPVWLDTLVLFYNKDHFNKAAIIAPPKTWDELERIVPALREEEGGELKQAAIALGSGKNIRNASRILGLLMLQKGAFRERNLNSSSAVEVMEYFLSFGRPNSQRFSWTSSLPNSLDAFAQGKVAMVIDYAESLPQIEARTRSLNLGIAPVPQNVGKKAVTDSSYWLYVVSRQSRAPTLAWEIITMLSLNPKAASEFMLKTGFPGALRSLIEKYKNDPKFSVFSRQALLADSWQKIDEKEIDKSLLRAIEAVEDRKLDARKALDELDAVYEAIQSRLP